MRKGTDKSGHSRAGQTWRVVDDYPDVVPVTPEELDVIEAFLMAQFRAVMAGKAPVKAESDLSVAADSEAPQTHAELRAKRRGNRR